jgi:hypothetical protein
MPVAEPVSKSLALDRGVAEEIYSDLLSTYESRGQSVEVDFRELISGVGSPDRATHMLHSYPAKLLRHIPAFVVASPQVCSETALIHDPFCGSGTTLVEAFLAGHSATGLDVNPLAILISKVKTTPLDDGEVLDELDGVLAGAKRKGDVELASADRLAYWYQPEQLADLGRLKKALETVENQDVRDLLNVALSATARDVSLANPRISVPVRLKPEAYPEGHELRRRLAARLEKVRQAEVLDLFAGAVARVVDGVSRLKDPYDGQTVTVAHGDARAPISSARDQSQADLILTSPPYLGAQKYIRATSLNLLCLEIADQDELRRLQGMSVGREFFRKSEYAKATPTGISAADAVIQECRGTNPLRAHLATEYISDMRKAIGSMVMRLRAGGVVVLVVGGNQLCGKPFDTPAYLTQLCEDAGLKLELQLTDTIRSRGLMTRRNREASPIASERVLIFRSHRERAGRQLVRQA